MKSYFKIQISDLLILVLVAGIIISVMSCSPRYGCYTGTTHTTNEINFENEYFVRTTVIDLTSTCTE